MTCRVCGTETIQWLDLGDVPLANQLLEPGEYPDKVRKYPLRVRRCPSCTLSQLDTVVPPAELFTDYPYRSGVNVGWFEHCQDVVKTAQLYAGPKAGRVLDIGANDGTLMRAFQAVGWDAHGVDPSPAHPDVVRAYFPEVFCPVESYAVVAALNVLGHVSYLNAFVGMVSRILTPDGVFLVEVPSLSDLLDTAAFDTIYHEHVSYWSVMSLRRLLEQHGLAVVYWEHLPVHGGSIRVVAMKGRAAEIDPPSEAHLLTDRPYGRFKLAIDARIDRFRQNHSYERTWAAFGAAAKGTIFCHVAELGSSEFRYVVDETPAKQFKVTPYGVPVVPMAHLLDNPVDHLLVLPWNHFEVISERLRDLGYKGSIEVAL